MSNSVSNLANQLVYFSHCHPYQYHFHFMNIPPLEEEVAIPSRVRHPPLTVPSSLSAHSSVSVPVRLPRVRLKQNSVLSHLGSYHLVGIGNPILGQDCAICLTPFKAIQYQRILSKCQHTFHKKCIDKWLCDCNMSCPICRVSYQPT